MSCTCLTLYIAQIILSLLTYIVSRFWQTVYTQAHQKSNFLVANSFVPLLCGRAEGGRACACWFLCYQSVNPLSFCHLQLTVIWQDSFKTKEYAMRLHQYRLLHFSFLCVPDLHHRGNVTWCCVFHALLCRSLSKNKTFSSTYYRYEDESLMLFLRGIDLCALSSITLQKNIDIHSNIYDMGNTVFD